MTGDGEREKDPFRRNMRTDDERRRLETDLQNELQKLMETEMVIAPSKVTSYTKYRLLSHMCKNLIWYKCLQFNIVVLFLDFCTSASSERGRDDGEESSGKTGAGIPVSEGEIPIKSIIRIDEAL